MKVIFQIRYEELHKYTVLDTIYLVTVLHTKWFFDIIDVVMMMSGSDKFQITLPTSVLRNQIQEGRRERTGACSKRF